MKLAVATAEQAVSRDRLSHADWDPGLGLDRFVAREGRLRSGPWPRANLVTWLWSDDGVLASCETYRMPSTWRGQPGTTWGIASVYTDPLLRGRGHASRMLLALAERLGDEPDAHALVLFSDVGASIYERAGFAARPGFDRFFDAVRGDVPETSLFADTELAAIHRPAVVPGLGIWPCLDQVDWHLDRARTRDEITGRVRPARCGARHGDDYAVWVDEGGQLLVVLITGSYEPLLDAARAYAATIGIGVVRAWETPGWPVAVGRREPRRGALPMIRPLAPDLESRGLDLHPAGALGLTVHDRRRSVAGRFHPSLRKVSF